MSACTIPLMPGVKLGRISGINSLPPFPGIACKLLGLISDDHSNFREVSEWLTTDAALSGQVLRIANSALFGFRQEVKSILQAICLVGANRVRDVVATVALKDYMSRCNHSALRSCWRHNLATALWGEKLARAYKLDRPLGYTGGLLHDLGRIALLMLVPKDYPAVLEQDFLGAGEMLDAERELFDFDHCQIGDYLSRVWNFQPVLTDIIGHHHDEVTPAASGSRTLIQAACEIGRA